MLNIEHHSIFNGYKSLENRVTSALLHIFKQGGEDFIINALAEIEDDIDLPSNDIRISTQHGEDKNVYDGLLEANFSFRLVIESKVKKNAIDRKQLDGLIRNAKKYSGAYILYITPDTKKPEILLGAEPGIFWTSWNKLAQILQEKIEKLSDDLAVKFLIIEFVKLLDVEGKDLLDDSQNRVQIAAGSFGEPVALKYNFYACQNRRTRRPSKYLTFYNKRKINYLFEIISVDNDIDLRDKNIENFLKEKSPDYSGEKLQFYKLKRVEDDLNILHEERYDNGNLKPFTMGVFRYTTFDKIKKSKTTKDL